MKKIMPQPKIMYELPPRAEPFTGLSIRSNCKNTEGAEQLFRSRFWNMKSVLQDETDGYPVYLNDAPSSMNDERLFREQGYVLHAQADRAEVYAAAKQGFAYAAAALKQLISHAESGYTVDCAHVEDYPSVEVRGISIPFTWYAGYGRIGFDSQLWNFEQWKQFLDVCSDYRINQLNMVLYGFWPFEFPEYPETVLRDLEMQVYDPENDGWLTVKYTHPNVESPFLKKLIEYGHGLGIRFFAYTGLNSYSGGYACRHPEKRMKKEAGSKFINDFDSLCLSDPETIEYLKASIRKIVEQGFDGIDFEESEEAFWYCSCEQCKQTFWKNANTPEEALHAANTTLLKILYEEIRKISKDCVIGLRAWRQPPLVRSEELIESMVKSVPDDIVLFWAPGQYVPDEEFEKWAKAFGKERIWGRDTEAIGFAACFGRLLRPFRWNGLRAEEETITQFVEEDIRQHRGSVEMKVKGINGYQFEWYGFFMALFAHSYYGWGGTMEAEAFYRYSLEAAFDQAANDVWYVMKNMLTIHESQMKIYRAEFPMARNKVEQQDIPRIKRAIEEYPDMMERLGRIREYVRAHEETVHFDLHFKKWEIAMRRLRIIYDMALASVAYDNAQAPEEKRKHLKEMYRLNEKEFEIIRSSYFDVNPMTEAGVKSCCFPYHEMKRILTNALYPEREDNEPIYAGVEALGWLWA